MQPCKLATTAAANAQAHGLSTAIPWAAILNIIGLIFPGFGSLFSGCIPTPTPTAADYQAAVKRAWIDRKQRYRTPAIHRLSIEVENQSTATGAALNDYDTLATTIGILDAVRLSPVADIQEAMNATAI